MTLWLLMPLTKTLPETVWDWSMSNAITPGLCTTKCKVSFWKERREVYRSIALSTTLMLIFHSLNIHAKYCKQHTSLRFECWDKLFPEGWVKSFFSNVSALGDLFDTIFSCKCLRNKEFFKEATFLSNLFWDIWIFLTINLFFLQSPKVIDPVTEKNWPEK